MKMIFKKKNKGSNPKTNLLLLTNQKLILNDYTTNLIRVY